MLYEYLAPLAEQYSVLNLFSYITFRSGGALATAFLICALIGEPLINWLRARQGKGQPIRDLSLEAQMSKQGTPTMGGFLIWIGLFVSTLLWADLHNPYVWTVMFVTVCFAMLGFLDDYAKVTKQSTDGVSAGARLGVEFLVAGRFRHGTVQLFCL